MTETNVTKISERKTISVGDTVVLKSGGPAMTVFDRSAAFLYVCWSKDEGSDIIRDVIPVACAEPVKS